MTSPGATSRKMAALGAATLTGDATARVVIVPLDNSGRWRAETRGGPCESSRVRAWGLILFTLSALDFLVTAWLLQSSSRFYEANPVARWFLIQWGLTGLMGFKFAIILGVIALGEVIERRRIGLGRLVLAFGSIAATIAIVQGAFLLNHPAMTNADEIEEIRVEAFVPSSEPPGGEPILVVPEQARAAPGT